MSDRRITVIVVLAVLLVGGASAFALTSVDGDSVPTYREFIDGTDPFDADTDSDGLRDGVEADYGTNPTDPDTDSDGLQDGEEIRGVHGETIEWRDAEPTDPDTDDDGIRDGAEVDAGLDPTSVDSDGDGLDDPTEVDGQTNPANPDTDGDNLLDGWEVAGETDEGAPLPGADPLHKDMYVQVTYLEDTQHEAPQGVFSKSEQWFAEMPVENPDGETGIDVRFYNDDEYSGPINRSIDEWTKSNGQKTAGVSGFMTMREFYNREAMGPRTGSYFLVVVANDDVPVRGSGNAGGSKTSIVRPWPGDDRGDEKRLAHTITHEVLHNVVRKVAGNDCNGRMHTCEGFLSYENDYFLSEKATMKLNEQGFADPVYPEQMNASSCEETISDPTECGT